MCASICLSKRFFLMVIFAFTRHSYAPRKGQIAAQRKKVTRNNVLECMRACAYSLAKKAQEKTKWHLPNNVSYILSLCLPLEFVSLFHSIKYQRWNKISMLDSLLLFCFPMFIVFERNLKAWLALRHRRCCRRHSRRWYSYACDLKHTKMYLRDERWEWKMKNKNYYDFFFFFLMEKCVIYPIHYIYERRVSWHDQTFTLKPLYITAIHVDGKGSRKQMKSRLRKVKVLPCGANNNNSHSHSQSSNNNNMDKRIKYKANYID